MPTFIVRRSSAEPRFATVDVEEIVIGRDPSCTVVLPEGTVSRQHLVIRKYPGPQYVIDAVKPTNPVMINGEFIRERTLVKEGDELQIADFHVIFSMRQDAMQHYVKEVRHYDGVCSGCGWQGRLGQHNKNPKCPACGTFITQRKDDLSSVGVAAMADDQGDTSYLQAVDVAKIHETLRLKTKARLRAQGAPGGHPLSPSKTSTIGAPGKSDLSASGLLLGGQASVAWEDDGWVARWNGAMSRMKHNGDGCKFARLREGDRLKVGGSEFKLEVA